jgi:hypothetical protein
MKTWFIQNWWLVWGIVGSAAYIGYRVRSRGGDESLPRRVLYALAPVLDPESEERKQLTPRAVFLFVVGLLILLLLMLFVPGFR